MSERNILFLQAHIAAVACCALLAVLGASPAGAAIPAGNVIQNPGAEADTGSTDGNCGGDLDVSAWAPETGAFSAVQYGIGEFPSAAVSSAIGGGSSLFTGGCASPSSGEQTADLSAAAPEVDAGSVVAKLSGYLGGYLGQADSATVEAYFLGAGGADLGGAGADLRIGPVTNAERGDQTTLLLRSATAAVPGGTRSVRLLVRMTRVHGSANDSYVDNLSLTFSQQPAALPPPGGPGGGSPCPSASMAFAGAPLLPFARASAPVNEVRVVRMSGAAEVKRAGCSESVEIREGTVLKQGDELNVDPDGEVVLEFGDNSRVTVMATSQLKIASFFTEGGIVRTELLLKLGQVAAEVNSSGTTRSDFRIQAPSGPGSVRGTTFSVFADHSKTSLWSVRKGIVSVRGKRGRGKLVRAGREVEATPRGVGRIARRGRAGAPKGGLNRAAAMRKVNRVLARADERCGFEVAAYSLRRTRKGWRVGVTLTGRTSGKAAFKVVGRKATAGNELGRRIARSCR